MRVALVQSLPVFGDEAANLASLTAAINGVEADFYVLPELCLSGYDFNDRAEAASHAFEVGSDPIEALARAATERGAGIAFGFAEKATATATAASGDATGTATGTGTGAATEASPTQRIYNSALLAFPDGRRRVYRKTHLFAREKLLFDPGDSGFFVEEFRGLRVGVAICFDWIFPESFRTLALRGADLIAHCSNLVMPYCQRVDYARAIENRVYVATANRIGTEARGGRSLHFTGESVLVAPDGEYLLRLPQDRPAVEVSRVHPAKARIKTLGELNDLFADRRPEFYS
jgi:predicted amidohydrolase